MLIDLRKGDFINFSGTFEYEQRIPYDKKIAIY